jgi:hypothetical protein
MTRSLSAAAEILDIDGDREIHSGLIATRQCAAPSSS